MNEVLAAFAALLENVDEFKNTYQDNPRVFLQERGYRFPKPIRKLFDDLYFEQVTRAVAVAGRGGGKTFLAAGLGFSFLIFKDFHVAVVAGSLAQALYLFEYAKELFGEPEVQQADILEKETKTLARTRTGAWFKVAPASTKAVRGLHAHGRGMLLILDEEAEMEPDIVRAALKVVKDAEPAIILRISTNHKVMGTFADLVDNHERLGYELYQWDSFDVAKIDHWRGNEPNWDFYLLPYSAFYSEGELQKMKEDLRKYWNMKPRERVDGWIRMEEIIQAFVESPREWFEVEDLGLKPSGEGLVLDPIKVDLAFKEEVYSVPTAPTWIGIDWGFQGMTAVETLQQVGEEIHLIESRSFTRAPIGEIVAYLKELRDRYGANEVYADSSHPFENEEVRNAGFEVTEVVFSQYKETGASWLKHLFDTGRFKASPEFGEVKQQLKNWRRDKNGKIVKKDDHHCDALLAGTKKLDEMRGSTPAIISLSLRRRRGLSWMQRVVAGRTS